jgi:hypothetical protein
MGIVEAANAGLLDLYIDSHTPRSHLSPPISSSKRSSRPKKPRESRKERKERLALLATQPVPTLFQRNPFKTNTSFYMPHSYTQNIESFCNQARKRRAAIFRNLRMTGRHVSHLVTINLYDPHHPALINPVFGAFAKELGKHNLDGHWTIEINQKNLLHWHLLVLDSPHTPTHLKSLIKRLLDKVKFPRRRVEVERAQNQSQLIDYVLKVLKPGYQTHEKEIDALGCRMFSISVPDLYATKRVLFVKETGLDKHGTFGNFWAKGWSQKKFWEQIKQERKQIEENMKDPKVRELVEHMHKTMGFSLTTAKWAFALNPDPTGTVEEQAKQKTQNRRQPKKQVRARRRFCTLYKGTKPNRVPRPLNAPGAQWAIPTPMRTSGSTFVTVTHYGLDVRIPRSRPP